MSQQLDLFAPRHDRPSAAVATDPAPDTGRQTCARVRHSQRGECWAVYDNGPSYLLVPSGARVEARVTWGGASSVRKHPTWLLCDDPAYGRVELDVLARGALHTRMWSPLWGAGWLVQEQHRDRFEADGGAVHPFRWVQAIAGNAASVVRNRGKPTTRLTDEEARWITYTLSDGDVYELRRGEKP
jgi:hypothetical protein